MSILCTSPSTGTLSFAPFYRNSPPTVSSPSSGGMSVNKFKSPIRAARLVFGCFLFIFNFVVLLYSFDALFDVCGFVVVVNYLTIDFMNGLCLLFC